MFTVQSHEEMQFLAVIFDPAVFYCWERRVSWWKKLYTCPLKPSASSLGSKAPGVCWRCARNPFHCTHVIMTTVPCRHTTMNDGWIHFSCWWLKITLSHCILIGHLWKPLLMLLATPAPSVRRAVKKTCQRWASSYWNLRIWTHHVFTELLNKIAMANIISQNDQLIAT